MFATLLAIHPLTSLGLGFSIHPSTVIGIAALAALYVWRARKGPAGGPTTGQRAAFVSGLAVLFFTLNGPFHDLSDGYLFTVHMAQHLVLTMLVPPLLLAGTPDWMLRPAVQVPWVFALAKRVTPPSPRSRSSPSRSSCGTCRRCTISRWRTTTCTSSSTCASSCRRRSCGGRS